MKIIEKKINEIIPYINNPRNNENAIDKVASSIKEFGFKVPIVIDKDNIVVTGHTRLLASKKLGLEAVPCIIADDLTEAQIKAFRIADNKVSEYAEWDEELLKLELEQLGEMDFDLELTGFNLDDLDFVNEDEQQEYDEGNDIIEEPPVVPYSRRGDIWLLGKHRLMCGSSTEEEDVSKLMNGEVADMCFTDPPYNINYGNIKHPKFKQREIQNDNMSHEDFRKFCIGYTENIKKYTKGCVYMAGPPGQDGRIMFTVADELLHCSTTIIWNKDQFTLGRGKYQNKYEPIWFGWVENGSDFTDDRKLVNVWDIPRPKKSELHPTMKPVELVEMALNHNPKSKSVLEVFGGSGTTIIASEICNKKCFCMELDEKYVDVIVKRYINHKQNNGDDVTLIRDGKEYKYSDISNEFNNERRSDEETIPF